MCPSDDLHSNSWIPFQYERPQNPFQDSNPQRCGASGLRFGVLDHLSANISILVRKKRKVKEFSKNLVSHI
jgi:hypothetical protein